MRDANTLSVWIEFKETMESRCVFSEPSLSCNIVARMCDQIVSTFTRYSDAIDPWLLKLMILEALNTVAPLSPAQDDDSQQVQIENVTAYEWPLSKTKHCDTFLKNISVPMGAGLSTRITHALVLLICEPSMFQ